MTWLNAVTSNVTHEWSPNAICSRSQILRDWINFTFHRTLLPSRCLICTQNVLRDFVRNSCLGCTIITRGMLLLRYAWLTKDVHLPTSQVHRYQGKCLLCSMQDASVVRLICFQTLHAHLMGSHTVHCLTLATFQRCKWFSYFTVNQYSNTNCWFFGKCNVPVQSMGQICCFHWYCCFFIVLSLVFICMYLESFRDS